MTPTAGADPPAGAPSPAGGSPRLLTIMGSGELAPTMVRVHRAMLERLGPPPVPAVLLDTPFAFQENAPELCERIRRYFAESLRTDIEVAGLSATTAAGGSGAMWSPAAGDGFSEERLVSAVRRARYVFTGPGSPSYALRKWTSTVVPSLLKEMLAHGGGLTFSSAAALTLGVSTVPVYEIYKVGADPYWLEGLDLMSSLGMRAAVIPHYNNAEGGTHDTRFCYLGERRLAYLETRLPANTFVLGVDEHTAVTFDLDERVGTIVGLGGLTVRVAGRSRTFEAGTQLKIDEILETAAELLDDVGEDRGGVGSGLGSTERSVSDGPLEPHASGPSAAAVQTDSPLIALVRAREGGFAAALARRDVEGAVAEVLELEAQITEWSTDIPFGDAMDRARASLRSLVVELGRVSETGVRDPGELLAPFVETMLELRGRARAEHRFDEADWIRERLDQLGVEVRDTVEGSDWLLSS
ncbi:MAG TPA: hypothetical protein VEH29_00190 [Acidimicrobiales bacterium]|nr:hypothetical protein [Acidimicrobiales bacterium]